MESILIHSHSGLRWILLITMIFVLFKDHSNISVKSKKIDWVLYTLILFFLQIIIGVILYFISHKVSFQPGFMKIAKLRFFTVEHITGMLLAFVIMILGYIKYIKAPLNRRNKIIKIYFAIALLFVLLSIPWPLRGFGNSWF